MLLRNVALADGMAADVRLADGTVDTVAAGGSVRPDADEEALDLDGYVVLPAPAEPHAHLDKAYTADRLPSAGNDLLAAIDAWHAHRRTLPVEDIVERARRAALDALARGATAIRTHVDVGEGIELRGVEALARVRDELRDVVDIQIVALTYPLSGVDGAANRELLRAALERGADVVGGAPHIDPNPLEHIEVCVAAARAYDRPIDLHMDEHMRPALDLPDLARLAHDFHGRITASHCVSLGMQPRAVQTDVAAAVARAGVGVVTLPLTNLYLQGRDLPQATPRGITAVGALLEAGATVAAGGDNVQDPFNPLGAGDPLQTAQLVVAAAHVDVERAYDLVSANARALMGLPEVRVEPGSPADLLCVRASSVREAIATATEDRLVFARGRFVARVRVAREAPV